MIPNAVRTLVAISVSCLCFSNVFGNPLPVWEDGEFLEGTWTHEVLVAPGEGTASVSRVMLGNPGACLSVIAESAGPLWVVLWNELGWDPSGGAVRFLTFQIDERAVSSWEDGQNLKALVVQNGRTFVAPLTPVYTGTGSNTDWQTILYDSLAEEDFAEIPQWPETPADHPDFSASGGVLYFGFAVAAEATPVPLSHLYDNWLVYAYFDPIAVESDSWGGVKGLYR